jgi:Domain of unknown function (DUF4274)
VRQAIVRVRDPEIEAFLAEMAKIEWFDEGPIFDWLLNESAPDEWHRIALLAGWDSTEPLIFKWIARQPDCEAATALVLFWKAQPEIFLHSSFDADKAAGDVVHIVELLNCIRLKFIENFYCNRNIGFDFERDLWPPEFERIDKILGSRSLAIIPEELRQSFAGRVIDFVGYDADGFPEGLVK